MEVAIVVVISFIVALVMVVTVVKICIRFNACQCCHGPGTLDTDSLLDDEDEDEDEESLEEEEEECDNNYMTQANNSDEEEQNIRDQQQPGAESDTSRQNTASSQHHTTTGSQIHGKSIANGDIKQAENSITHVYKLNQINHSVHTAATNNYTSFQQINCKNKDSKNHNNLLHKSTADCQYSCNNDMVNMFPLNGDACTCVTNENIAISKSPPSNHLKANTSAAIINTDFQPGYQLHNHRNTADMLDITENHTSFSAPVSNRNRIECFNTGSNYNKTNSHKEITSDTLSQQARSSNFDLNCYGNNQDSFYNSNECGEQVKTTDVCGQVDTYSASGSNTVMESIDIDNSFSDNDDNSRKILLL